MLAQVLVEGLLLGILLMMICAIGIRNGAVGMVHLYHQDVKNRCVELGLTTHEKIRRNSKRFKVICISGYMLYILVCVYGINGARDFCSGFLANVCHPLGNECHGPFSGRWFLGRPYDCVDDSGNRSIKAIYHQGRQTQ